MKKRILTWALVCVVVFGAAPAVWAEETVQPVPAVTAAENGTLPFTDMPADAAYYDSVADLSQNKLFAGVTENTFAPETLMTRGMFLTVLWRMAEKPRAGTAAAFTDLTGDWYRDAVNWGAKKEIVSGYGGGVFAPDAPVSRQEMLAMLYRYALVMGYDTTQGGMAIREYQDYEKIAEWALPACAWGVNAGLFDGETLGVLNPRGTVTRAQAAEFLQRFIQLEAP